MNGQEARKLIESENYGVVLFYGCCDFTPGSNFLFAAMPKRGQGAQWHRDIIPAMKRYMKRFDDKFSRLVTGTEGHTTESALSLLANRQTGDNDRIWVAFEWEKGEDGKQRGRFVEIDFEGKEEPCDERVTKGQLENLQNACDVVGVGWNVPFARALELYHNQPNDLTRRQAAELIDWTYSLVSRENAISWAVKMVHSPLATMSRPDREFALASAKAYELTAVELIEAVYNGARRT